MSTETARAEETPPPPGAPAPPPPREPLGRRFHALLASTGLANLADGVVQIGVPLYAVTLSRSPLQISLLSAAAWLPWLLLALLGGMAVDRSDRKRVQVAALSVRAVLLLAAAAGIATGRMSVTTLVAVVLLYGATDVLVDLAENAIVPDVAPRSRLQAANGRVQATQMVAAAFVGAPIAGALLGFGAAVMVAAAAGLAAAAAAVLALGLRGRYRHAPAESAGRGPRAALTEIRAGLSFLVHHPALRPLTVAGALFNMASTGFGALVVLWAVGAGSAIGLSASQFVWVGVAQAAGAVIGSTLIEAALARVPELRYMLGAWWVAALALAVPVLVPHPAALYPAMVVIGAGATSANVVSQTVRQRLVPAAMLGRVTGASRTLGYGLMPVGALAAGVAATHWGLAPVMLTACAVMVLTPLLPALTVRQRMLVAD